MHLLGSDLHLNPAAVRSDHRRMQRLVHVRLRHGDIVLETAGNRLPGSMDDTEGTITVAHRLNDNPEGGQIVNLVKIDALPFHFEVDGIKML